MVFLETPPGSVRIAGVMSTYFEVGVGGDFAAAINAGTRYTVSQGHQSITRSRSIATFDLSLHKLGLCFSEITTPRTVHSSTKIMLQATRKAGVQLKYYFSCIQ
jgi:hypothetical protein